MIRAVTLKRVLPSLRKVNLIIGSRALNSLSEWLSTIAFDEVFLSANCCDDLLRLFVDNREWKTHIIDIGKDRNLSIDELEIMLQKCKNTERTLVISVWAYGLEPDIKSLHDLKMKYGFILLEDRCLARPNLMKEMEYLNELTDAYLFSTGYSKYCDLHYGGWLIDTRKGATISNDSGMDWDLYLLSVEERRKMVDEHKKTMNIRLRKTFKEISINEWIADTWRISCEIENPQLLMKIIKSNGVFCSNHYSHKMYKYQIRMPKTYFHMRHVINIFNDLRVGEDYCSSILESIEEYKNALHYTGKIR